MPKDGFTHVPFEYPSTQVPLEQAAAYLKSVMDSLTDVTKISFVVHSMGGIVVRRYLKDQRDPRLHRMVMMGTPNGGAELADMLKRNLLFKAIYGPAGQELISDPLGPIKSLPTPDFEFGIVVGGKGDDKGFNRLLPGDDDGTVTVASARLPGAADFLRIPKIHAFLMSDATVISAVQHFLEHGRFFPDKAAEPITG
jgi:pimeloyl-ACP methyl ester carboxylesterase